MGFFSSLFDIGSKIAGVLAAPATGGTSLWATLGSTALDVGSKLWANQQSKDAASDAWTRTMGASNTSYQRATADMRAAGLNPILAYSQGGASTPTAQVADTSHLRDMNPGTRPIANALSLAQVANTAQSTRTSAASERLTSEQAVAQRLNNEGLARIPPEYRALAQMAGQSGLDAANARSFVRGAGKLGGAVAGRIGKGASQLFSYGRKFFGGK